MRAALCSSVRSRPATPWTPWSEDIPPVPLYGTSLPSRICSKAFLPTFNELAVDEPWLSAMRCARRIFPDAGESFVVAESRDISRKLSNLCRFGYLQRRLEGVGYVYALVDGAHGASADAARLLVAMRAWMRFCVAHNAVLYPQVID